MAALFYGGHRVLDGAMQVGVLTSFLLYLRRFFDPMQDIAVFYNSFQSASAALEKLSGVLEEQPEVAEPEHPTPLPHARGGIALRSVRFGYRDSVVLPDLDLTVPAGQTVALVGATGAGKTTVARLLARFYDPQGGQVSLDGIDLRELSDVDLRRAVVLVTQENFLFSGSVADNIAFGRPDAPRADVVAAARAIGADGFIAALPDGYDTDVRKRGGRLSAALLAAGRTARPAPRLRLVGDLVGARDRHALLRRLPDPRRGADAAAPAGAAGEPRRGGGPRRLRDRAGAAGDPPDVDRPR